MTHHPLFVAVGRVQRLVVRALTMGLAAGALTGALTGCGGGGGGGGSSSSSGSSSSGSGSTAVQGTLSLGLLGGASRNVDHVWVTVSAVAMHAQTTQAWSSSDSSWTVVQLNTPAVIDLTATAASQSDMSNVVKQLSVSPGTYAQLRLFPLAHDAALHSAASAKGLSYNAQVDYTDAQGHAHSVPLELPSPELGWRIARSFTVSASTAVSLAVEADLQHSLVRLSANDGLDHFTFRPQLQSYNLSTLGAILGVIDVASICGGTGASTAPNCATDIVVSAQRLSADGSRYVSVRQSKVGSDGYFNLYPLPGDAQYDVVITGRRMQTMVVKAVDNLTVLSSPTHPIYPVLAPNASRTVNLASAMSPSSSQLFFGQTLSSGGKPYEVAVGNVDPFTGLMAQDLSLPEGPVSLATYNVRVTDMNFVDTVPQQGSEAFSVQALGAAYDDAGAVSTQVPPARTSSTITVGNPTRQAGLGTGQIQVTVNGTLSSAYDKAQLLISDVNGVVATQGLSGAGSTSITVPAGSQAAALGGTAVYSVALRASGAGGGLKWVRATNVVDLRSSASASVTLTLP
jgi:hypothetical protein